MAASAAAARLTAGNDQGRRGREPILRVMSEPPLAAVMSSWMASPPAPFGGAPFLAPNVDLRRVLVIAGSLRNRELAGAHGSSGSTARSAVLAAARWRRSAAWLTRIAAAACSSVRPR